MTEEVAAGGKEFAVAMLWAAMLYILCGLIMEVCRQVLPGYYFIGAIISVLIFCVFGFFVLTRYASRFTYTLSGGRLRINRMVGKRNKEIEFACGDIINMYYGYRPASFVKRPYNMRKSLFSKSRLLYIEYRNKDGKTEGVVIQPSDKLRKKIERERTGKND